MLDADVASNPYGLAAIVCAFAFVVGQFSLGPLKYGELTCPDSLSF